MPFIVYCTAALTSLPDNASYITFLFSEWLIWIGANDLCLYCKNNNYTPETYIGCIREASDNLHKEVPKVLFNLDQVVEVTKLSTINQNSKYCRVYL